MTTIKRWSQPSLQAAALAGEWKSREVASRDPGMIPPIDPQPNRVPAACINFSLHARGGVSLRELNPEGFGFICSSGTSWGQNGLRINQKTAREGLLELQNIRGLKGSTWSPTPEVGVGVGNWDGCSSLRSPSSGKPLFPRFPWKILQNLSLVQASSTNRVQNHS